MVSGAPQLHGEYHVFSQRPWRLLLLEGVARNAVLNVSRHPFEAPLQPSNYFASGAGAPFSVTAPLTVFGSTVISFSLASTSAGTSF